VGRRGGGAAGGGGGRDRLWALRATAGRRRRPRSRRRAPGTTGHAAADPSRTLAPDPPFAGAQALRCLALAMKPLPPARGGAGAPPLAPSDEAGLTFVAIVAMHDPPRRECAAALQVCRDVSWLGVARGGRGAAAAQPQLQGCGLIAWARRARRRRGSLSPD
jgi:hypothetical protein